jgi:hypothetical protein
MFGRGHRNHHHQCADRRHSGRRPGPGLAVYLDVLGFAYAWMSASATMSAGSSSRRGALTSTALVRVAKDATAIDTQIRLTTANTVGSHRALRSHGVDTDGQVIPYAVPMFAFGDPDGNVLRVVESTPSLPDPQR